MKNQVPQQFPSTCSQEGKAEWENGYNLAIEKVLAHLDKKIRELKDERPLLVSARLLNLCFCEIFEELEMEIKSLKL